jgi:putative transposase
MLSLMFCFCRVLKVFRTRFRGRPVTRVMKLDQRKIHWIIRQKQKGVPTKQIALDMKISQRRVQQVLRSHRERMQEPVVGENMGRPRKPFDKREEQVVSEAFARYRFGARMLEVAIRKVFKIRISHNRIHMYLKAADLAHEDPQKKKRRKWVRYEREHSLSAGHIDWHESGWSDLKVCAIIDDASRMILAGGEFKNANTENSKLVVDQLVERYWWLCPMREIIMDHGAEFGAHRIHEDGKWNSDFKKHLERHGIKPILAKVKHPQTNGKLERWFGEYQRHRLAFSSFEEFRDWYNNRPHGSLDFEHLETPEKAFRRKMRLEMYFAIGHRLFGL